METFFCPTKLYCGSGAMSALGRLECQRLFLVTEPLLAENGMAQRVVQAAKCSAVEVFDQVGTVPAVEVAAHGAARLRAYRPDLVAVLGRGSTLDCGKAMSYFARGSHTLAALPTTSGSGGEVTDFAWLTHGHQWQRLSDPRLRPDVAILDSDLLEQMPKQVIAEAGFEVLAHAVEGYVARRGGAITALLAREAFGSAYAALPASYAGNTGVRLKIHLAASLAGMAAAQAGTGLGHAMAQSLGRMFHVPHGQLHAILLPAVVGCNAHVAGRNYGELARAAGLGGSTDAMALRNLKNGLVRLRRELNLPQTLAQAGVDPRRVWRSAGELTSQILEDPCCRDNPMPPEDFLVRRILEEVTGHL